MILHKGFTQQGKRIAFNINKAWVKKITQFITWHGMHPLQTMSLYEYCSVKASIIRMIAGLGLSQQ